MGNHSLKLDMDSIASKVRHGVSGLVRRAHPGKSPHKTIIDPTSQINQDSLASDTASALQQRVFVLANSRITDACNSACEADVLDEFMAVAADLANAEKNGPIDGQYIKVGSDSGTIVIKQNLSFGNAWLTLSVGDFEFPTMNFTDIASLQNHIKHSIQKITYFQAHIRRHNATQRHEPKGQVPALRYPDGTVFAYKIGENSDKHLGWACFPPPIPYKNLQGGGAYKKCTHADDNWVGLTLHRTPDMPDPAILEIIIDKKFDKIVPQFRVNKTQMISKNLGYELFDLMRSGHVFKAAHFVELAKQIHELHELDIVLRDIKLENMFLKHQKVDKVSLIEKYINSGAWEFCEDKENMDLKSICISGLHVHLSDLDSMGKVGSFKGNFCTNTYLTTEFLENCNDNAPRTRPFNAYEKDQFAFFSSMMFFDAESNGQSNGGKLDLFIPRYIDQFLKALPCDIALKSNLKNFLLCPKKIFLHSPLHHYLLP